LEVGNSPSQYLKTRHIYKRFQIICRRDLLRMRHARLAAHAPSVIAETILFLFQIAILETFILIREAHRGGKGVHAKGNQQRSGDNGGVAKKLEKTGPRCCSECSLPSTFRLRRGAHKFKADPKLGISLSESGIWNGHGMGDSPGI